MNNKLTYGALVILCFSVVSIFTTSCKKDEDNNTPATLFVGEYQVKEAVLQDGNNTDVLTQFVSLLVLSQSDCGDATNIKLEGASTAATEGDLAVICTSDNPAVGSWAYDASGETFSLTMSVSGFSVPLPMSSVITTDSSTGEVQKIEGTIDFTQLDTFTIGLLEASGLPTELLATPFTVTFERV